jgi:hypothetical protein
MKVLRRPIGFLEGPPGPELEKAVPLAKEIANTIRVLYYKIELVGTIRRKKATVGNIDFVINNGRRQLGLGGDTPTTDSPLLKETVFIVRIDCN